MLIISRDTNDINATKCMLESKFVTKNLEVADKILGIRIIKTRECLAFSRSHCIGKVLE